MKAIMLSIQPYYVFLIIARLMGWNIPQDKTVEVRKDFPKDLAWNRQVHIYCSKNRKSFNRIPKQYQPLMAKFLGKVIREFVCNKVCVYSFMTITSYPDEEKQYFVSDKNLSKTCLSMKEMENYGQGETLYGWHISDLKIYDKPKELWEFFGYGECEPDPIKCHACKYMEHGNSWAGIEADCNPAYDGLKQLNRPPQSWRYVEELSE
mgnify:CR=1 FL=1